MVVVLLFTRDEAWGRRIHSARAIHSAKVSEVEFECSYRVIGDSVSVGSTARAKIQMSPATVGLLLFHHHLQPKAFR